MITILTEPSFLFFYALKKEMKNFIKKKLLNRELPKYAGHYAVVRSLIDGLEKINQEYNYNPTSKTNIAEHVHVLAGVNTLKAAIRLKQKGKIKKLTAGPNIVISSADENGFIASPEVDLFLVPSKWVKDAYTFDNNKLRGRVDIWPAGVDPKQWDIIKQETKKPLVAFYKKRPENTIYEHCYNKTKDAGYDIEEIICGNFTQQNFKDILKRVKFVVFFVEQESQGIALQEIWATDTPTIVWNPEIWMYKNVNYACTSSPYLTEETGIFFKTKEEFDLIIQTPLLSKYNPRKWVLENMTDEICAKNLVLKTTNNIETLSRE